MSRVPVVLDVNGHTYPLEIEPHRTLLSVLREDLALTGTKANCLEGECGACTVLVDGQAVNACLYLAVRAQGKRLITIEGLAAMAGIQAAGLHPLQQAFVSEGAVQCGYCTPGFILAAAALLAENPHPTEADLTRALAGNLCRCTGYVNIRRAVRAASEPAGGQP
jgi:carbon-monoxide dehydrogenase small subunit